MSGKIFFRTYLPYLLAQAAHRTSGTFHRELKRHGVRELDWRVLATLLGGRGKSVNDLAVEVLAPQSTLSRRLDSMAGEGLIARRPGPADRRTVIVTLTDKGAALARDLAHTAAEFETRDTAALDEEERRKLKQLLEKLLGT